MSTEAMELIKGTVVSEKPLEIQAINDDKLVIHEGILCLPRHLTDYKTKVDIRLGGGSLDSRTDNTTCTVSHSHQLATFNIYQADMTVYNALKVGETVYILSFNRGKKYYLIDREAQQ